MVTEEEYNKKRKEFEDLEMNFDNMKREYNKIINDRIKIIKELALFLHMYDPDKKEWNFIKFKREKDTLEKLIITNDKLALVSEYGGYISPIHFSRKNFNKFVEKVQNYIDERLKTYYEKECIELDSKINEYNKEIENITEEIKKLEMVD